MEKVIRITTKALLLFTLLFGVWMFVGPSRSPVDAQTCGYWHWGCTDNQYGCTYNYQETRSTVGCTINGTCADGAQRCEHSGYQVRQYTCDPPASPGGDYQCKPIFYNVGAGYCCGAGGSGGDDDGGGDDGGGTSCNCNSCSDWQCTSPAAGLECIPAQSGQCSNGATHVCRNECCSSECSTGGGCTPSSCACVPPGAPSTPTLRNSSVITRGTIIDWQLGISSGGANANWGTDGGQQNCPGVSCTYSGAGTYQAIFNGTNQSWRCRYSVGSGTSSYLPGNVNYCIVDIIDPTWPGTNVNFSVVASNQGCGSTSSTTVFPIAPNNQPFCNNYTVTGGRLLNGNLGVEDSESFTVTASVGESDTYGPPSSTTFCYAVRGQTQTYYRNSAAWRCFTPSPAGNSASVTTTYSSLVSNYNPSITYIGDKYELGFIMTTNVADNFMTGNYCSTNVGYNNGSGTWCPSGTCGASTCNGGTCVLNIFDNRPDIQSASPTSLTYIGTETDTDNGIACVDNNPYDFNVGVSDPDGSADIDIIELSIADSPSKITPNPDAAGTDRAVWESRIRFAKDWNGVATNSFMLRDIDISTGNNCYTSTRTLVPKSAANANCYKTDTHNWRNAALLPGTVSLNGATVQIYYLTADIEVYNSGRIIRLKGSSNWQSATYVAYEVNGTRAWMRAQVAFLDDGSKSWHAGVAQGKEYALLWSVFDIPYRDDQIVNIPNTAVYNSANDTYHQTGSIYIDFTHPGLTLNSPVVRDANRLDVAWNATDSGSQLLKVAGEASHSSFDAGLVSSPIRDETADANNDINVPAYDPNNQSTWYNMTTMSTHAPPLMWNRTGPGGAALALSSVGRTETVHIGDNEEGTITFNGYATDRACNLTTRNTTANLYLPWMISKGGNVYSKDGTDILVRQQFSLSENEPLSPEFTDEPFLIYKDHIELSTELLYSATTISSSQIVNQLNSGVYRLDNYTDDNNRNGYWYNTLEAQLNTSLTQDPDKFSIVEIGTVTTSGGISTFSDPDSNCLQDSKICIVKVSGNLTLTQNLAQPTNPFICDRKAVVMITGDLTVDNDITTSTGNGCIFITRGNIVFLDGQYKSSGSTYPKYDIVQGFFIADGQIVFTETDPSLAIRDGIKLNGSVIAFGQSLDPAYSSVYLQRSLKLLDNFRYPAEVFVYDARYLEIAKEVFGVNSDAYKRETGFKPL